MKTLICFILIFLCFGCSGKTWTKREKSLGYSFAIATAADYYTTSKIKEQSKNECITYADGSWRCDYSKYETNPRLGKHPSQGKINRHFAASTGIVLLAADWLPSKWSETLLESGTVIEFGFAYGNYLLLDMSFKY